MARPESYPLLGDAGATATGAGSWVRRRDVASSFQAVLTGTGAVTAEIDIEASNDGVNALETAHGTITLVGTDSSSDGFETTSNWLYVRANVTALTGTGATVKVLMGG